MERQKNGLSRELKKLKKQRRKIVSEELFVCGRYREVNTVFNVSKRKFLYLKEAYLSPSVVIRDDA